MSSVPKQLLDPEPPPDDDGDEEEVEKEEEEEEEERDLDLVFFLAFPPNISSSLPVPSA